MFWRPKDSVKDKCYVFNVDKERTKKVLVYLDSEPATS